VKVVVSRAAAADLERLRLFLSEQSASASKRAVEALAAAIDSLEIFPERGRPSGIPGVRELVVPFGASAYLLRYAYLGLSDSVVILRVWHGREAR
jgi:toxin ParE1/3/4